MKPEVKFDRTVVTVLNDATVHLLVELAAPDAEAADRPPLDVVCVIDTSGSMSGAPLEAVKDAVSHLLRVAGPTDRIGVVTFSDESELVLSLDHHDADRAIARIGAIDSHGMTNLSAGWLKGIEMLEAEVRADALRRVIVLTDGHANMGETDPDRLAGIAGAARSRNITTSTIGFGDGHDETLLEVIADTGAGNDYWCAGADQVPKIFGDEFEGLASVVAQNVSVELRPSDGVVAVRVLNEFPIVDVPGGVQVALGDAYGGERRRVVAELLLPPVRDAGPYPLGEIVVRWTTLGEGIELHTVTVPIGVGASVDPDAVDIDADPEVIEQVNILRAAAERREAARKIDLGDFDGAATSLHSAAAFLSNTMANPRLVDELRRDAERARRREWDQATSKKLRSESRGASKGRKVRYDEPTED